MADVASHRAIVDEVTQLATDLDLDKRRAFIIWYARLACGLYGSASFDVLACYGKNDRGIDLLHFDEEWRRLIIGQVEYPLDAAACPASARLTLLLNRVTELTDMQELRAANRPMLLKAAERLADARSRGYAVQLQWIYPGRREAEIDRLARSFNRRNLREDVSVNIVSLDDLLELKQQSSAERSAVEENGLLEFERDEPTAAVRGLRDDPDSRATMPIPNDSLEFDDETITGSYDLEQEDTERPEAFLIVLAGNREGEMVRLGSRMIIGRGSRASFRIDDSGISREHLSVAHAGEGRTSIVDLDSRNGVYLNGRRIKRAVLKDGDKIRIGANTVLKYALADALDESFQQRMYDAALRDPLTGLYNRRHLMDQLETEFSFALRHHGTLSLVLIDVDHFKELNDTRGHLLGDTVLRGIASRLRSALRKEDLAARYGGDEFAILCRDTPAEIAETAARRVLRIVRRPELIDSTPDLEIGACLGVASIPHPQLLDHLALFKAADEALYRAKNAGRNRLCVFGRGESGEFS